MAVTKRDDGQISLGPWPHGMNNRQPDHALPEGAIRNGVNVDFDNEGMARRRAGFTKAYSGVNIRAGYSCSLGVFFVENNTLMQLHADDTAAVVLAGVHGEHCAYEFFNGAVYFSDGLISKKITPQGVTDWGMEPPAAPVLDAEPGPGDEWADYIGALVFLDQEGNESGASPVTAIRANREDGIFLAREPAVTDPQAVTARLFLSKANGSVLYDSQGRELVTQFMTRPPAGQIIRHYNGRMYIAAGNGVWYTEPFSLDLVKPASSFYQFPQLVTVMEPVEGGIWIVSDHTYFLAGSGPDDFTQRTVLDYGAALGTGQRIPGTKNVAWYSARGVVTAGPGDEIKNIQEEQVAPDAGSTGAMVIREADGLRQAIASIRDPSMSSLAARSFIEAEIVRRKP